MREGGRWSSFKMYVFFQGYYSIEGMPINQLIPNLFWLWVGLTWGGIWCQYITLCRSITSLDLITSDACCIGQSNIIWSDDWYLFVLLAYFIVVYLGSLYILNLNVSPLPWSSSNCEERTLYVHHQFSRFHSRVLFMDQLITVLWSMPCSVASRTNDPA